MRSCLETVENARPLLVGKRRHPSTVVLAAFGPGVFRQQRQRQRQQHQQRPRQSQKSSLSLEKRNGFKIRHFPLKYIDEQISKFQETFLKM